MASPGLRIVGDVGRMPAINLKAIKVIGMVGYTPKGPGAAPLEDNPFEKVVGGRSGTDPEGREYTYNYYGPNNRMDDEYLRTHPPINLLDDFGREHDLAYAEHGYNTPGAREADRVMVEQIKAAIKDGRITEESPFDELKRAKAGLLYFSTVDVK